MDSQHIDESAPAASGVRLLLWIAGFFAASLLLGGALAGPVFNVLLWLGRNFQSLEALRDVEFAMGEGGRSGHRHGRVRCVGRRRD